MRTMPATTHFSCTQGTHCAGSCNRLLILAMLSNTCKEFYEFGGVAVFDLTGGMEGISPLLVLSSLPAEIDFFILARDANFLPIECQLEITDFLVSSKLSF